MIETSNVYWDERKKRWTITVKTVRDGAVKAVEHLRFHREDQARAEYDRLSGKAAR